MNKSILHYLHDEDGAGAAEFALIILPLTAFLFGFMHLCMMMYTTTQLHWAAEDAARCAAVRANCKVVSGSSVTTNKGLTESWAGAHYKGLTQATFTYTPSGCGHTVVGDATYTIKTPLFSPAFALQSKACFP